MHTTAATSSLVLTYGLLMLLVPTKASADAHVVVRAVASEAYTAAKFGPAGPKLETYVFMEGRYFAGTTVDRSISRMPFRRIAEMLAPDLARQNFRPAKTIAEAELILVVHWGTTIGYISAAEMTARTTTVVDSGQTAAMAERALAADVAASGPPMAGDSETNDDPALSGLGAFARDDDMAGQIGFQDLAHLTDQIGADMQSASNARLLGYTADLRSFEQSALPSEDERALRHDLSTERYFIIVRAYDLRDKSRHPKPVWTVFLNTRSPGINFATAVNRFGAAGADFFGRTSGRVATVRTKDPKGKVTIEPAIILGIED
jgi:hypothetical protein